MKHSDSWWPMMNYHETSSNITTYKVIVHTSHTQSILICFYHIPPFTENISVILKFAHEVIILLKYCHHSPLFGWRFLTLSIFPSIWDGWLIDKLFFQGFLRDGWQPPTTYPYTPMISHSWKITRFYGKPPGKASSLLVDDPARYVSSPDFQPSLLGSRRADASHRICCRPMMQRLWSCPWMTTTSISRSSSRCSKLQPMRHGQHVTTRLREEGFGPRWSRCYPPWVAELTSYKQWDDHPSGGPAGPMLGIRMAIHASWCHIFGRDRRVFHPSVSCWFDLL